MLEIFGRKNCPCRRVQVLGARKGAGRGQKQEMDRGKMDICSLDLDHHLRLYFAQPTHDNENINAASSFIARSNGISGQIDGRAHISTWPAHLNKEAPFDVKSLPDSPAFSVSIKGTSLNYRFESVETFARQRRSCLGGSFHRYTSQGLILHARPQWQRAYCPLHSIASIPPRIFNLKYPCCDNLLTDPARYHQPSHLSEQTRFYP
ncbi:hypothetical protein DFS33DRAFT_971088 [Desarmillaria ectypa]|nr:hypothetical protein DFS33DRAFT_971088 [Desarmillaria ectypa]